MAKAPTSENPPIGMRPKESPSLPAFDDDKMYRVQLWKSVEFGGRRLTPASPHMIRGRVAKGFQGNIHTATVIEETTNGNPAA